MNDKDNQQICSFPKNAMETLVFSVNQYKGRTYLDMRLWAKSDNGDGQEFATKKGITIGISLFPQFKAAMAKVETALIQQGLIDIEDLEAAG
jgi:hypothetical protein